MRREAGGQGPGRPALLIAVAIVTLLAAGGSVLWWHLGRSERTERRAADFGVVHIHGLGINPADGALFIASHTGLLRVGAGGDATRTGGTYQDVMALTVVGPDRFLASGHPDLRDLREGRLPPLLGLMESRDGGQSWRSRSLLGTADFHALQAVHGQVYGYDSTSGTFMVSNDGTSWDARGKTAIVTFVVNPEDPERIVAAVPGGVRGSEDGGRTWAPLPAPALVALAWERPGTLLGITMNGDVYRSGDAGRTWGQQGTLNARATALLSAADTLFAASHDGSVYRSADGGRSWALHYRDAGDGQSAGR